MPSSLRAAVFRAAVFRAAVFSAACFIAATFTAAVFRAAEFQAAVFKAACLIAAARGAALVDPATAGAVVLLAMSALFITSRLLISDFFFMVPSSILFNPDDQLCHVHDSCQTMNTVKTPLKPST